MNPYCEYFAQLMPHMHELIDTDCITGATLSFPVEKPLAGEVSLHFTAFGMLFSMGERYSSKLVTTWDDLPILFDINTNDSLGPLECIPAASVKGVESFMKSRGTFECEVTSEEVAQNLRVHFESHFATVNVGVLTCS